MFGLFGNKKNHFVGIDFGTSTIKIVELSYSDQKVNLENYGVVNLAWIAENEASLQMQSYEERMIHCVNALMQRMGLISRPVFVAIPGYSGLVTLIEFPEMKEEEIAKAIQFEAHKYIPTSLDEVAMSWEIVAKKGENKEAGMNAQLGVKKKIQVLLVAAPKKEIVKYEHLVAGTGLSVSAIELETFSITRSLVGDDAGNFLIVDIGSRATNIILIEDGIVRVNRNIDAGGNEITSTIAEGMNISKQRAEILKCGENDLLNTKEGMVIPVLELIVGESMRILKGYQEKNKEVRIDNVILSGGSSRMKGIEQYFNRSMNIPVVIGDPWKKIVFDPKLTKNIRELNGSFSVALGLALRGVDEYKRK